jgi:hypothetical protein
MFQLTCVRCDVEMIALAANRKYCDECFKEKRREDARRRYSHTPTGGTVDLTCETCQRVWHSRNNRGRWCPECRAERAKAQIKAYSQRPEVRAERYASMRAGNYQRESAMRKYGITVADYELLYEAQGGKCGICEKPEPVLCVDHCHRTNRVRGLLCRACNRSIGQLGDTADALQRAADYLRAAEQDHESTEGEQA